MGDPASVKKKLAVVIEENDSVAQQAPALSRMAMVRAAWWSEAVAAGQWARGNGDMPGIPRGDRKAIHMRLVGPFPLSLRLILASHRIDAADRSAGGSRQLEPASDIDGL
jgi:hypothetical protein